MYRDSFGVVVLSMKELGSGEFREFTDSMFSNAGLVMGTDATKGDGLPRSFDGGHKFFAVKNAVISMVVLDRNAIRSCVWFVCCLACKGFFSGCHSMDMYASVSGCMIDDDSSDW